MRLRFRILRSFEAPSLNSPRVHLSKFAGIISAFLCALGLVVLLKHVAFSAPTPSTAPAQTQGSKGIDLMPVEESPNQGNRWALLIGINNYSRAAKLHCCVHDVEKLYAALVDTGYDPSRIKVLTDKEGTPQDRLPTLGNIRFALTTFLRAADSDDTVLVAFSGHGKSVQTPAPETFLIPQDGPPLDAVDEDIRDNGLSINKVHEYLERCPARQKVLVIDACQSGASVQPQAKGGTDVLHLDISHIPRGKGIVEIFSCGGNESSWEDPDGLGQGVFSHYFTRALRGDAPGIDKNYVTVTDAFYWTHDKVQEWARRANKSKQEPVIRSLEMQTPIILSARPTKVKSRGLEPVQLVEKLNAAHAEHRVSEQLLESARRWSKLPVDFAPANCTMRLLPLLADGSIDEIQFNQLAHPYARQLQSHESASGKFDRETRRAVVIAIDKYPNLPEINASEEAKFLAGLFAPKINSTAATQPALADDAVTYLLNERATRKAALDAIEQTAAKSSQGDLIVLIFSGRGMKGRAPESTTPFEHRGASRRPSYTFVDPDRSFWMMYGNTDDPNVQVGIDTVLSRIKDCKADVLIVSCACDAVPATLPELFNDPEEFPDGQLSAEPARLFVGYPGVAFEYADSSPRMKGEKSRPGTMTRLARTIARGLAGEADLTTPRFYDDKLAKDSPTWGSPDGFVTLRELALFLRQRQRVKRSPDRPDDPIILLGNIGDHDVVLSRSTLPTD